MTSREQFESECRNGLINGGLAKHENGKYASELTDAVWRGWQASREALEVKLPPNTFILSTSQDTAVSIYMRGAEAVVEAIRSAGIKVIEGEKKNG